MECEYVALLFVLYQVMWYVVLVCLYWCHFK